MEKVLHKGKSATSPSGVKSSGQQKSFIGPTYGAGHMKLWAKGSQKAGKGMTNG